MSDGPLTGLARIRAACGHSLAGLRDLWRLQEAARIEIAALLASIPIAPFLATRAMDAALLIAVVLLILIVEVLNSAVEAAIDRIGPERHELSRIAKDLGSLAVLLSVCLAALVWGAALWTRFA